VVRQVALVILVFGHLGPSRNLNIMTRRSPAGSKKKTLNDVALEDPEQ
jgi:hypothetical protein